ncbi:beta-ketoacyl-[acyl-carrier-protein] synthase family protein [Streptomyces sp. NBC_01275]|uniref:beta-ketoacyl-[acyl-carrier-protein] synthase family protein n=1 Tax=Streptomyces sp. NBC_01275 TaxID=2903807 RepID=UPI002256D2D1|nr:beta-ketoacyl synthase N-terminal-like domain-containing protein [Streptomyces sp. NBC_01275]MCX4763942.1 beta-ketoacyl-[acyl-carrier-protein] synthase family protein [Streptomyces sp. NBC_01275]
MNAARPPDVLVTGLGTVSCLGLSTDEYWAGLQAACSRPSAVHGLATHVPDALAYQVPSAGAWSPEPEGGRGRATEFALHASRQAVADAGLSADEIADMAVVIGTAGGDGTGCAPAATPSTASRADTGEWSPMFSVASAIGAEFGAFGTNLSVSNACAASGYALSMAAGLIRRGEADTVLVGGAEALAAVPLAAFRRLGVSDPHRCRPFDADRQGTVFGEGAALLVVQSARAAAGRRVYGRIKGTAWSCDGHHPTSPDPEALQLVRAAEEALREAGSRPEDVGCVIPHGTGTQQNDVVETQMLHAVLGEHTHATPLFSLKAFIGHTAGSAAAFGALTAALMARQRTIPANVRLARQDPACPLWIPQDGSTPLGRGDVLINAYGFGGNNFSMVFGGEDR